MRKHWIMAGLLVLLLAIALVAGACGEAEEATTTTAAPSPETTAPPSAETTAPPTTDAPPAGPATGEPIKIGMSNSLTGISATPGVSVDKGVMVEIEYVNQQGGINGRPLELIRYDDRSEIPGIVANLTRLIEEDQVFATIGPFVQFGQETARQIAEQAQVPMVGPGPATLEQIEGPVYQWSVMLSAAAPVQADAVTRIIKENGWKNLLGIADVLSISHETLDLLVEGAAAGGYAFTKMPDTFGFDVVDFTPILNRMMEEVRTVKPDAIILYVNMLAAPSLYRGLRGLGVTVPIIGGPATAHPAIFAMGPQAVEGLQILDSGGGLNPPALPDDRPAKQVQVDFSERYKAAHGQAPDFFGAFGASMVTVLAAAMREADELDRTKVAEALVNLKDVPTPQGVISFTPETTYMGVRGGMVLFEVRNAQFELVKVVN